MSNRKIIAQEMSPACDVNGVQYTISMFYEVKLNSIKGKNVKVWGVLITYNVKSPTNIPFYYCSEQEASMAYTVLKPLIFENMHPNWAA